MKKDAGILMPISSLPSKFGIGDFGKEAYEFINRLNRTGCAIWQILPLNPTGYGNSPYQPYSSYAGNELFISLEKLEEVGLLQLSEEDYLKDSNKIDYDFVREYKDKYLRKAFKNFMLKDLWKEDYAYVKENFGWIKNYAAFITLKKQNDDASWFEWSDDEKNYIVSKDESVIKDKDEFEYQIFLQYVFYEQWFKLKEYANSKNIKILGDIPIYVGLDSCDVWENQRCFLLDDKSHPTFIAGVPPDYFSETGQRWGNPIYDWEYLEKQNFKFWIDRLSWNSTIYDIVRIDHFRAFDTYWKIPADCPTAIEGEWVEAPGYALFNEIYKQLPDIKIVAEDLGDMREEVFELRDYFGLSGMKIAQFEIQPHNKKFDFGVKENSILYTGTHDNQTLKSWYRELKSYSKIKLVNYFRNYNEIHVIDKLIHACFDSSAKTVILPVQDLIGLDDKARLNTPGTIGSPNWEWKLINFVRLDTKLVTLKNLIDESGRKN